MTDEDETPLHPRVFLIADIRGYTRFTQQRGDEAAALLASAFAEITEETVTRHRGVVVELRGDEALAVFDSARQSLRTAVALQKAFASHTEANPDQALPVGIGVDAGEAVPVASGYRGGALNVAARLCSLANPGEVLTTEVVTHLARKIDGLVYAPRGVETLRGLDDPIRVVAVRPEGTEVMLPAAVVQRSMLPGRNTPFQDLGDDFSTLINARVQAMLDRKLGAEAVPWGVRVPDLERLPPRQRQIDRRDKLSVIIAIAGMLTGIIIVIAIIAGIVIIIK